MRMPGVDVIKAIAILGVICIHTNPFGPKEFDSFIHLKLLFHFINQASKFGVPFFFIASGFFFGRSLGKGGEPIDIFLKYFKRLLPVFIIWSAVFSLIPANKAVMANGILSGFLAVTIKAINSIIEAPFLFLMNGTWIHLWFLPALIVGLAIVAVFLSLKIERYLIYFALFLFIIGLLGGAYSHLPIGFELDFNTRNGPFFSTLFIAIGWILSNLKREDYPTAGAAFLMAVSGLILQSFEAVLLLKYYGMKMHLHDYLIGTLPFAAGVFLLGLNYSEMGKEGVLQRLGKFTLGIYVSHTLIMMPVFKFRAYFDHSLFQVIYPLLVYAVSALLTYLLLKNRFTKFLVA
ncbi:MAG: acyltransferase [Deltaproteobacteria bacterium]|nr:acyltransferase [Deltaproteobacteria bacterium]